MNCTFAMRMKVTVADDAEKLYVHQLFALCDYLTVRALNPFFQRHGVTWDEQFAEFFVPAPGSNPYDPTGVLHFFPPAMFAGQLGELENAIRDALKEVRIIAGPFEPEYFPDGRTIKLMRIPILTNPNANSGPPEVVMSDIAAHLVLRDVLGFQKHQGVYEMDTAELLQRVENVTEEKVQQCASSPLRDPTAPRGVRRMASPVVASMIHRCLGELRLFAQWALAHHHPRVRVA